MAHYRGKNEQRCLTVGELKKALDLLPKSGLIESGFDFGVAVSLMTNYDDELDQYVSIEGLHDEVPFEQWFSSVRERILAMELGESFTEDDFRDNYDDGDSPRSVTRDW